MGVEIFLILIVVGIIQAVVGSNKKKKEQQRKQQQRQRQQGQPQTPPAFAEQAQDWLKEMRMDLPFDVPMVNRSLLEDEPDEVFAQDEATYVEMPPQEMSVAREPHTGPLASRHTEQMVTPMANVEITQYETLESNIEEAYVSEHGCSIDEHDGIINARAPQWGSMAAESTEGRSAAPKRTYVADEAPAIKRIAAKRSKLAEGILWSEILKRPVPGRMPRYR